MASVDTGFELFSPLMCVAVSNAMLEFLVFRGWSPVTEVQQQQQQRPFSPMFEIDPISDPQGA